MGDLGAFASLFDRMDEMEAEDDDADDAMELTEVADPTSLDGVSVGEEDGSGSNWPGPKDTTYRPLPTDNVYDSHGKDRLVDSFPNDGDAASHSPYSSQGNSSAGSGLQFSENDAVNMITSYFGNA